MTIYTGDQFKTLSLKDRCFLIAHTFFVDAVVYRLVYKRIHEHYVIILIEDLFLTLTYFLQDIFEVVF